MKVKKALKKVDEATTTYSDYKLARSLIQLIPLGIGSAIDSFMGNRAQEIQSKRFKDFVLEIKNAVENLDESKIDKDYLESDDFFFWCKATFQKVVEERNTSKFKYFRQLFIGALKKDCLIEEDFRYRCLDVLNKMSYSEINLFLSISVLVNETIKQVENKNAENTVTYEDIIDFYNKEFQIEIGFEEKNFSFLKFDPNFITLGSRHVSDRDFTLDYLKGYGLIKVDSTLNSFVITPFGVEFIAIVMSDEVKRIERRRAKTANAADAKNSVDD